MTDAEFFDDVERRLKGKDGLLMSADERCRLVGTAPGEATVAFRTVLASSIYEHLYRRRRDLIRGVTEKLLK